MATPLPRLRANLDFMPSPVEDRPGLLVRDPFNYSPTTLIIPPVLAACLEFYDGSHSALDLKEMLVRLSGDLEAAELERHLTETLMRAGFLDDEHYAAMREERHKEFADSPSREPAHAGTAYPEEIELLSEVMRGYLGGAPMENCPLLGIAAPHVSPEGGWESYRAAYGNLNGGAADRVFVVLGTSHYGQPERFGLTRKAFVTPFGKARTATALVDWLEAKAGPAVLMEDYCHSVEHSIEFQVVFLQHLYGPDIEVLPILCGAFANSTYKGGKPEDDDGVRAFLDSLGELSSREAGKLCWVLGVDMAHMGRRYSDPEPAHADAGEMLVVAERDHQRIGRMAEGDADGFWDLVQQNQDDLKWCGAATIYTFLKAVPSARGQLERYQQWNIDPESVVSFAGMTFRG